MRLYEYYNITDEALARLWGDFWQGQTFTPGEAHTLKKVRLKMYRLGSPGNITASIKATDVDGLPTGADLCVGTTDGNTLPTTYSGEWREITDAVGCALDEDTKYCIVVRALDGDVNNYVRWLYQRPPTYPPGEHVFSSDAGVHVEKDTTRDMKFEEWGDP